MQERQSLQFKELEESIEFAAAMRVVVAHQAASSSSLHPPSSTGSSDSRELANFVRMAWPRNEHPEDVSMPLAVWLSELIGVPPGVLRGNQEQGGREWERGEGLGESALSLI